MHFHIPSRRALRVHDLDALPRAENGQILTYLAQTGPAPTEAREVVTAAARNLWVQAGSRPQTIEIYTLGKMEGYSEEAGEAMRTLLDFMGFNDDAQILCVASAASHADEDFGGAAFVSKVLHTGPSPYFFTSHTFIGPSRRKRVNSFYPEGVWRDKCRILSADDLLIFDPLNIHSATPLTPRDGSLLVMLQQEQPLMTRADMKSLLRKYPRAPFDRAEDASPEAVMCHNGPGVRHPYERPKAEIERMFLDSLDHYAQVCAQRGERYSPKNEWGQFISGLVGSGTAPVGALGWRCPRSS